MLLFLKKRWVYHVSVWALLVTVILSSLLISTEGQVESPEIFTCCIILISFIGITYAHFFFIDTFFLHRKYFQYFLSVGVLASCMVIVIEIQNDYGVEIIDPPVKNFISSLILCAMGAGVRYFKRGIVNQYQLQELKAKNAEIELQMLKTQLNPHFLFNTLNNICGVNQVDSEKGTEMMMELGDLLRYHLSYSTAQKISLKEEVELIKSYVALERLRLTESSEVVLHFPTLISNIHFPPLLFLPFIENAFKHGTHVSKPSFVHISVETSGNKLLLVVENSVHENLKSISTSIGLENTQRRLALLFPGKHTLDIRQDKARYRVGLRIEL